MWYGFKRGEDQPDFAAEGDRGQIIYVSPHKNLIIVRNGDNYGIPGDEWAEAVLSDLERFLILVPRGCRILAKDPLQ